MGSSGQPGGEPLNERPSHIRDQHIHEHLKGVRLWSPDSIILASPLIVGALIGPAAVYTAKPLSSNDGPGMTTLRSLEWQTLELALTHFAEYWNLGAHLQGRCSLEAVHYLISEFRD